MNRTRTWLMLLIVSCLMLAACVRVPTSGPVVPGGIPGAEESNNVEIAPEPPAPGAQPMTIVEGFLHAMASYDSGYDVARQFLTEEARGDWRPQDGVQIYADGYPLAEAKDSVELRAPRVGNVAADGSYRTAKTMVDHDFGLVQVAGEWRISNPPVGLLIPEYLFKRFYQRINLYFFDPSHQTLVPDPIYLPTSNQSATTVVRRLLEGATEWLSPVVVSAAPQSTSLNVAAPIDTNGVVEISLSDPVQTLDENARTRLAAQLVWTVRQLSPSIHGIRIMHNGQPLSIPGQNSEGVVPVHAYDRFAPSPPRLRGDLYGADPTGVAEVVEQDGQASLEPVTGPAGNYGPIDSMAVNTSGDKIALVGPDQDTLVVTEFVEGEVTPLLADHYNIERPQFTRFNELWVLSDEDGAQKMTVITEDGKEIAVALGDEVGEIETFRVSPDGLRIVVVHRNKDGSDELLMGRIARSDRIFAEGWRSLQSPSSQPLVRIPDIGWTSSTMLSVLLAEGEGSDVPAKPYTIDQAGANWQLVGQPDNWNAVGLATSARRSESRVVMLASDGTAWRYDDDFRWPRLVEGLTTIAFPG